MEAEVHAELEVEGDDMQREEEAVEVETVMQWSWNETDRETLKNNKSKIARIKRGGAQMQK